MSLEYNSEEDPDYVPGAEGDEPAEEFEEDGDEVGEPGSEKHSHSKKKSMFLCLSAPRHYEALLNGVKEGQV